MSDKKLLSVKEAQELVLNEACNFGKELIALKEAAGRVLAESIVADRNYPPFNRAAVDGYAIRTSDLMNYDSFEVIEVVHAGSVAQKKITPGTTIKIMTGAPVPQEANGVIKVEDVQFQDQRVQFFHKEPKKWVNIAREGEDLQQGATALPYRTSCTPAVLGSLASLGKEKVTVYKYPVVSIISTGSEIKAVEESVLSHQIRDSNSFTLEGFFNLYGIAVKQKEIVPDEKDLLKKAITKALSSDIIIVSGGVSMGDADFVPEVLAECGVKNIFHKVAIRPGKPIWFGRIPGGAVVFALPGNPFSCQVAFKVFIENYLRKSLGLEILQPLALPLGVFKRKKVSFDEYFPCRITDHKLMPLVFNGSGDIFSVHSSHGLALHSASEKDLAENSTVSFFFWKSPY